MPIPRFIVSMLSVTTMILAAGSVFGQTYPNKLVRIVTYASGGGGDWTARQVAQALAVALGQPVIVDNRGGEATAVPMVANAAPDGYTLLQYGSAFWIAPLLHSGLPYDPVRDLTPISLTNTQPHILVVHPSLPARSVKELIAFAKAKPGAINWGNGGSGSSNTLAGELFRSMAGIDVVQVFYKATAQAIIDLMSGQIQMMFLNPNSGMPQVKAGKLKALAVTSTQPTGLAPGLPTVAEVLPGFESGSISGLYAPVKTPEAIIKRLNQELVRYLNTTEARKRYFDAGFDVVASSPQEALDKMKSDIARIGKVIKDAGLKMD